MNKANQLTRPSSASSNRSVDLSSIRSAVGISPSPPPSRGGMLHNSGPEGLKSMLSQSEPVSFLTHMNTFDLFGDSPAIGNGGINPNLGRNLGTPMPSRARSNFMESSPNSGFYSTSVSNSFLPPGRNPTDGYAVPQPPPMKKALPKRPNQPFSLERVKAMEAAKSPTAAMPTPSSPSPGYTTTPSSTLPSESGFQYLNPDHLTVHVSELMEESAQIFNDFQNKLKERINQLNSHKRKAAELLDQTEREWRPVLRRKDEAKEFLEIVRERIHEVTEGMPQSLDEMM